MAKTEAGEKKGEAGKPRKTFKKRGEKRVVHHGLVHIHASFNNTQVIVLHVGAVRFDQQRLASFTIVCRATE